jgi:hypothetical protein
MTKDNFSDCFAALSPFGSGVISKSRFFWYFVKGTIGHLHLDFQTGVPETK